MSADSSSKSDVGNKKEGLFESVKTIVYAVLIALVIRTMAYEPFNIPSGSMLPTLLIGDYVFVAKYPYGYSKHSLPWSPPLFHGRIFESPIERGDVVVFKKPTDNRTDYIKRIVGLPGDRLQMIGGILHINGKPVERTQVEDFVDEVDGRFERAHQFRETLPNGKSYLTLDLERNGLADNTPVYAVPAGHYFGMGDNRDNSTDSRFVREVGYIPAENIVGRADILFFSVDGSARWWQIWKWPMAIRYGRLFNTLD